jgi:hypothetical protein
MKKKKILFLKGYGAFGALPRLFQSAHCRIRVFAPLRLCVINQPKSTPLMQNTGPIPAPTAQKMKSPLDSGCERTAFQMKPLPRLPRFTWFHVVHLLRPITTYSGPPSPHPHPVWPERGLSPPAAVSTIVISQDCLAAFFHYSIRPCPNRACSS